MIRRDIFTALKRVLSKAWGSREWAGNESVLPDSVSCWQGPTTGKLQHLRQLPAVQGDPLFPTLEIPFRHLLWALSCGETHGITNVQVIYLYRDRGITDEMRCLRCLGSGQQFTGALAAKEECYSFPDSDSRLEEKKQQLREQECVCTCSKRRPLESHFPPLGKSWATSAAKGSGDGANRHRLASQSQLHSGAEWRATHDGRRCLASRTSKKSSE